MLKEILVLKEVKGHKEILVLKEPPELVGLKEIPVLKVYKV